MSNRIYLQVLEEDKELVKGLGCKFDFAVGRWFYDAWVLPAEIMPYAPVNYDLMIDARFASHSLSPYEEKFLSEHSSGELIEDPADNVKATKISGE